MRRASLLLLVVTAAACAQTPVTEPRLSRVLQEFESRPGDPPLACEVTPVAPELNFAFRFLAGYTFHVPVDAASPPPRSWTVLTSITPQDGQRQTTYLLAEHPLSRAVRVDADFDLRGIYFLGVGTYTIDAALRDERHRLCRKQWQVVVKPSRVGDIDLSALPPNAVRPVSFDSGPETSHPDRAAPVRLSLLLNVAPMSQRRTSMRTGDQLILISSLTAMLEHIPASSVRLAVFSLEQQREIFHSEQFTVARLREVVDAVTSLQLATVNVDLLRKPMGHVDFLTSLINREFNANEPPDRLVIVGPPSRYGNRIPEEALRRSDGAGPAVFYIRYEPARRFPRPMNIADASSSRPMSAGRSGEAPPSGPEIPDASNSSGVPLSPPRTVTQPTGNATDGSSVGGRGPGPGSGIGGRGGGGRGGSAGPPPGLQFDAQSDIISEAVSRLKGKTLNVHTPAELGKAIQKIERR